MPQVSHHRHCAANLPAAELLRRGPITLAVQLSTLALLLLAGRLPLLCRSQCYPSSPNQCGCFGYNLLISRSANRQPRVQQDWGAQQPQDVLVQPLERRPTTAVASDHVNMETINGPVIKMWPGGIVFFAIDDAFSKTFQASIRSVVAATEKLIGSGYVEFKEAVSKSGQLCRKNYVRFQPIATPECKAMLGMQRRGITSLWLNETHCNYPYAIQHELLHAMGRLHEHSRRDRDQHLEMRHHEMYPLSCGSFALNGETVNDVTTSLPYDPSSIMHYDSCAGSCRGNHTFVLRSSGKPLDVNYNMTELDVRKVRLMYPAGQKVRYSERLCRDSNDSSVAEEPVVVVKEQVQVVVSPRARRNDTEDGAGCVGCWSPFCLTTVAMATVVALRVALG